MREFKMRASQAGKIMGKRGLGKTGETYIKEWLINERFGRKRTISSNYLTKGNENEDLSLQMVADHFDLGFLDKNEEYRENDYFQGTPDAMVPGRFIIDVKSSWNVYTFPFFEEEIPNSDYYYQLQVYMDLFDYSEAKLVYTLTDTPERIIESEARKFAFANGFDPDDANLFEEFEHRLTFKDIPEEEKIKIYHIDYDPEVISLMRGRVWECREIINQINKK